MPLSLVGSSLSVVSVVAVSSDRVVAFCCPGWVVHWRLDIAWPPLAGCALEVRGESGFKHGLPGGHGFGL
jgi:hypothetical protein